jgi:outer membrane protein OmpA-like peptidoglycan-associated protein
VFHSWLCRHRLGRHRLAESRRSDILWGGALVVLAIPPLLVALSAAPTESCGQWLPAAYPWLLGLMLASGLQRLQWPRLVLYGAMIWALLATCTATNVECVASSTVVSSGAPTTASPPVVAGPAGIFTGLATSVLNISNAITSALTAVTTQDEDADMVASAAGTGSAGVKLVSINQAVDNPKKYLSCRKSPDGSVGPAYSIYLGSEALFDLNSDTLKPAAARASLPELLELLVARPETKFVITGHTDSTGTDAKNLRLSRQRAEAVATWLETQGIARNRLSIIGEGSAVPIIRPAASIESGGYLAGLSESDLDQEFINRVNRRVEISVDCPPRAPR